MTKRRAEKIARQAYWQKTEKQGGKALSDKERVMKWLGRVHDLELEIEEVA